MDIKNIFRSGVVAGLIAGATLFATIDNYDQPIVNEAKASTIYANSFYGLTSKELMAELIAEGYQPAISQQALWDMEPRQAEIEESKSRVPMEVGNLRRILEQETSKERNDIDEGLKLFPMSLEYRALSEMLSKAEGTKGRYDIMLGGGTFSSYETHPKLTGEMTSRGTAAGKFQMILPTYLEAQKKGGFFPDFTPYEQERWFMHKIKRLGITQELLEKAVESSYQFNRVIDKMSGTWSPMPQMDGTGKYKGQNPKPQRLHYKRFKNHLKGIPINGNQR